MSQTDFLPGVPVERIISALDKAGGKEIQTGKFSNPESSAALACNVFGWFIERPIAFPPLPGLEDIDWPAVQVSVERCLRFPWRGGRHPWLDAVIETQAHLIGIESKRFEPFRDTKNVRLSAAYDRPVWGDRMRPFEALRDDLRLGLASYEYLDATQLVKHAFGLVTQGRALGKSPVLFYIFAEPRTRGNHPISDATLERHRAEIADFAKRVAGAEVAFASCSYREWLSGFSGKAEPHARAVIESFGP